jgi:hypothetical protein
MNWKSLLALPALLFSLHLAAQPAEGSAVRGKRCTESVTVFQDVSKIGRKDRLAANITRRHQEMAREGWRFVDMELYVENADLEGAFLSYTRAVPCPAAAGAAD